MASMGHTCCFWPSRIALFTVADQLVNAVRYLQKGDRPCAVMGHVQVSCAEAGAHGM